MSSGNPPLNIFGNTVTVQVSGADSNGKLSVVHDVTPPLGGPPLHKHLVETEAFHVLEGSFVFELDGVLRSLGTSDSITILPGVVHLYQNVGDAPGRMLIVTTPSGLDEFFVALDELLNRRQSQTCPPLPPFMLSLGWNCSARRWLRGSRCSRTA